MLDNERAYLAQGAIGSPLSNPCNGPVMPADESIHQYTAQLISSCCSVLVLHSKLHLFDAFFQIKPHVFTHYSEFCKE
jgi:hypothetical protein